MAKLRSFLRTENFDLIIGLVKQYGDFFRVWLGPELNILVSDPKDVEVSHELWIKIIFFEQLKLIYSKYIVRHCTRVAVNSIKGRK